MRKRFTCGFGTESCDSFTCRWVAWRSDQAELVEQAEVVADDPALDDPALVVEAAEGHRVPGEHPAGGATPLSMPSCVPV